MDYWSKPMIDREQMPLFAPTLGAAVAEDHPVRMFDEILGGVDWGQWEAQYPHQRGRPPIHPQVMAAAILYGLNRGIRSSRKLEDACMNRVDFIWLVEGREIDRSTFADFRTRFGSQLKGLFRQVGRVAARIGLIRLVALATDGTRVKANNSRHRTATAATLERDLAELDAQLAEALSQMAANDHHDDDLFGQAGSDNRLPSDLATLGQRREALSAALSTAKAADQARQKAKGKKAKPVQVPLTDQDAKVQPNKEGGFAPNYTPMATTDSAKGFIVDEEVINGAAEAATVIPMLDRVAGEFGQQPAQMFLDGAYGVGQNLAAFESCQIEAFTPIEHIEVCHNPAVRSAPNQPVPADQWDALPLSAGTKKLDRTAFIYDEQADCYHCPMGERLTHEKTKNKTNACGTVAVRIYRCHECEGCALAPKCMSESNRQGRTVQRDAYEPQRQRMISRMNKDASKELYKQRMWIGETPFAHIKEAMGIRQFLLRGLTKVQTEWRWACTAFNMGKLVRELTRLRSELAIAAT